MSQFGLTLRRLREGRGSSQSALARAVGVNASYINRLESGDREAPRRDLVLDLAVGLALAPAERDELLLAAGQAPQAFAALGADDPTLNLIAATLADERLPLVEREELRSVLTAIVRRWRTD